MHRDKGIFRWEWTTVLVLAMTSCWGGAYFAVDEVSNNDESNTAPIAPPTAFNLVSPPDLSTDINSLTPSFTWVDAKAESDYVVEVDDSPAFTLPLAYQTFPLNANTTSFQVPSGFLTSGTPYYWRVTARNSGGITQATNTPLSFTPQEGPWGKAFETSVFIYWNTIRPHPDGGFFAMGLIRNGGDGASHDISVVRFNSDSTIAWQKSIGGTDLDDGRDLFLMPDGGFLLFAQSYTFRGGWFIKLNSAGTIEWQKSFNTGGVFDSGHAIVQTTDGGFLMGGSVITGAVRDAWVTRFDDNLNVLWETVLGGASQELLTSVIETPSGGAMVAVRSDSFSAGVYDLTLFRLDPTGAVLWQNSYGGADEEYPGELFATSDGAYLVSGATDSFGVGGRDAWLLKINLDGSVAWQFTLGQAGGDSFVRIRPAPDGNYLVIGHTDGAGLGMDDAWVVKVDNAGTILSQMAYGGTGSDRMIDIFERSDGSFLGLAFTSSFAPTGGAWIFQFNSDGSFPGYEATTAYVPSPTFVTPQSTGLVFFPTTTTETIPDLNPSSTAVVTQLYP